MRWAKRGSRSKVPMTQAHLRINVAGAVCPSSAEAFALTIPYTDTESFQIFIDEFAKAHPPKTRKAILLLLDNASWHKQKHFNWHHIKPLYLPPYSPDLNPIEVLWKALKDNSFSDWYAKTLDALQERVCSGLKALISNKSTISSLCTLTKYQ